MEAWNKAHFDSMSYLPWNTDEALLEVGAEAHSDGRLGQTFQALKGPRLSILRGSWQRSRVIYETCVRLNSY